MKNRKFVITFDDNLTPDILKAFGKLTDKDGYLIESSNGRRVLSRDGQEIKESEWGGIVKGSEVYLKSDIVSLINYVESCT